MSGFCFPEILNTYSLPSPDSVAVSYVHRVRYVVTIRVGEVVSEGPERLWFAVEGWSHGGRFATAAGIANFRGARSNG
jgi:hypothetical protein